MQRIWIVWLALAPGCSSDPDAPIPRPRAKTDADSVHRVMVVDSAPLTIEFVRFDNRHGPMTIDGETRPVGTPSATQAVVVRIRNTSDKRSVGSLTYRIEYVDSRGRPVPLQTRLGLQPHDSSRHSSREPLVGPRQSGELRLRPNHGPIPPRAARAEIHVTEICETRPRSGGFELGECWWRKPTSVSVEK